MNTIYDYLKKYKDYDIEEKPWNIIDNLLLSIIVYIPIDSFLGSKTFSEMCNIIESFEISNNPEFLSHKIKGLIEIIKDSKRYSKLKFKNFENYIDNNTQFGAMTCIIGKIKIIVFKGTDRSIIGWLENFRLMYEYPTYTQSLALKYLKRNISLFDKNVYVVGHSKGGNMAMSSAMEISNFKFNKIKEIDNFDGPGFRKKEFKSEKYKKMSKKLINIVPSYSYIGTLMFNNKYNVISTDAHAINVHYPIFWNISEMEFTKSKLSKLSIELNERTSKNIENINEDSVKLFFEEAFKVMDNKKTENIKFSFKDLINILKTIKGIDKETVKYVNSVFKSMFKISKMNEKRN